MATQKSTTNAVNFLPEVFRTEPNRQVLSSSLDVLTSQPDFARVEGFIGNKYGYAVEPKDRYVVEPTKTRADYQLTPSLVFLKDNTQTARDFIDYPGLIQALSNQKAVITDPNRLFESQFYSWESFTSLDMIVNYSQYYWLPLGPDAVAITTPLTTDTVDIADIIGQPTYTTPNGIVLVNGLKIVFECTTVPSSYEGIEYYVEGVGTSINLIPVDELLVVESTGEGIYNPWGANPWDTTGWSIDLYVPVTPDYLTISRNSRDRNAWSRSNRWFNQSVIDTVTAVNGQVTVNPSNTQTRARRPIIQFEGNLAMWDSGNISAGFVNFIDTTTADPFSDVVGQPTCVINDGHPSISVVAAENSRVIFAAAADLTVRQTVYVVNYVPAGAGGAIVVALTPVPGITVVAGTQVYVVNGPGNLPGTAWRWSETVGEFGYSSAGWAQSQKKIQINQAPLFDIFDLDGQSLSLQTNSTFAGTELFSYTPGTGPNDPVLGFPISYSSVSNLGDINFDINLNSDTYTTGTGASLATQMVSEGFVHWSPVYGTTVKRTGWVNAAAPSVQYQVFTSVVEEDNQLTVDCDVLIDTTTTWAPIQVYLDGNYIDTDAYTIITDTAYNTTSVMFNQPLVAGQGVSILMLSEQTSPTAYYTIPANLQNNPFNTNITQASVGDIRGHYTTIFTNAPGLTGEQFGTNNFNNLGDLTPYGTAIIQNSASLALPMTFLRRPGYDIHAALQYNSAEYADYKNTIVDIAYREDYSVYQSPADILDNIIYKISQSKSQDESFFWSDMVPSGSPYASNTYNFGTSVAQAICPLGRIYDFTSANYYGVLVYLIRTVDKRVTYTQLIRDIDYVVSTDDPSLTVTYPILAGDKLQVKEYNQTYGSYIPNTPTKLGLYQATLPKVYTDNTYTQPTQFIVGHDGSYNKLYGDYIGGQLNDFRDIALLEFETRVYNNLKWTGEIPLQYVDLFPGEFRSTGYSHSEIMPAYTENFLNWAGINRIDYKTQVYSQGNPFTYNYNKSGDKLQGVAANATTPIQQGYWRGIYLWFYDTTNPADAPWEMLGFTDKPTWWDTEYGAAPYLPTNTMWADLRDGFVRDPSGAYIEPSRIRPQLLSVLPVDDLGNLRSPFDSVVGSFDPLTFKRGWVAGDVGPAEASYLKSSQWPFDLMKLLATFRPAKFYNLFADRDLYKYNADLGQYLFNGRYHLEPRQLTIYGNGTSKNSYINWIVDYINQSGTDGATSVTTTLQNIDVRLTYRLAGFSDKQYLKFLVERSTPTSNTPRLLIPDDSFDVLLYDNVAADRIQYSSVIIQRTRLGWTVWGNSLDSAYFTVTDPTPGPLERITVNGTSVQISTTYRAGSRTTVAYGTEFYSLQGVSEFLRNYGRCQAELGVLFDNIKDGVEVDWTLMIKEFMVWATQGWEIGSTISVNPNATLFNVYREGLIVQPLTLQADNFVLNQNLIPLQQGNLAVLRNNEEFSLKVLSVGDAIAYTNLNLNSIEHAVVFNNTTTFNDTVYQLTTGLRQNRLIMSGNKTAGWTGYINASGFVMNEGDIQEWTVGGKYPKGQIVLYKDNYWSANELSEPQQTFDYNQWTQINYEQVKVGLLPNPSTQAYEATKFYDIYQSNLSKDQDLLAFGLIGFRPRQYMVDAELSDITQVNVYLNMIPQKGTNLIANAFKSAELTQGKVDYDVRENWAIKNGDFGGVMNNNFVEVALSQQLLSGNPSIVGFSSAGVTPTQTDETVDIVNFINYGRAPTTANFLPPFTGDYRSERGLPTAGYVNTADAKFTAYEFDDLNLTPESVATLYTTDYVWIANYRGSWAILQPQSVGTTVTTITNNLDGTVTVTFAGPHGLSENDPFLIADFDALINGYFTVKSVSSLNSLVVDSDLSKSTARLTGQGIAMKLVSRRFAQASDATVIPGTQFATHLSWVDDMGDGKWRVLAAGTTYDASTATTFVAPSLGVSVAYTDTIGYLSIDGTGKLYRNGVHQTTLPAGVSTATSAAQLAAVGNYAYCSDPNPDSIGVYCYELVGSTLTLVETINAGTNTGAIAVSSDRNWLYLADATNATIKVFMKNASTGLYGNNPVATLSGPTGESFGASIATTTDGSKLVVGAPTKPETIGGILEANVGIAYIYARGSQSFMADGTTATFDIEDTSVDFALVTVNSQPVTSTTVDGVVTLSSTPADGAIVTVDWGTLTLQQTLESLAPHDEARFGNSVSTNRYGAEIMVGVPYELDAETNTEGAVYRYTNSGQLYGTITATPTLPVVGDKTIYIDGYKIVIPDGTATTAQIAAIIEAEEPTNVTASSTLTTVTISTKTGTTVTPYDIIDIVGATTGDLAALGLQVYGTGPSQIIRNPDGGVYTSFGWTVAMNKETSSARDSVVISATTGTILSATTFDNTDNLVDDDTIFDNGATSFNDSFTKAGSAYQFDYLPSSLPSVTNPGQYVFGQYCVVPNEANQSTIGRSDLTNYGSALAFNDGVIAIGSPTWYTDGRGRVDGFTATTETSSWYTYRQPSQQVDINLVNNISLYDTETNQDLDYLDYIDPVQGKMLSAVETNIDFIGQTNPASYTTGVVWGEAQVGKTWLDTSNLRMMNYSQASASGVADNRYNAEYWGVAFPGSTADIYTWVESVVQPINYTGLGFVVDLDNYTTSVVLDRKSETLANRYYFWVKNYTGLPQGKQLSPSVLTQYILNPVASGVAFLAPLTLNAVALYNVGASVQSNSSALHLGYGASVDGDTLHQDWSLIQVGTADSFLAGVPLTIAEQPSGMYLKYLNSFMGGEVVNSNFVTLPDTSLPPLVRYGTQFRPRQSMFIDRLSALKNYIDYANSVIAALPITEDRGTYLLEQAGTTPVVYNTEDYWTLTDWWAQGYSANTKVVIEVATYTDLATIGQAQLYTGSEGLFLSLSQGLIARVAANGQGLSETYVYDVAAGWVRIGLQSGTVQLNSTLYTDTSTAASMAVYWVIRWLTEQVFTGDLQIENNNLLMMMFNLIQSQSVQQNNYLPWLNKTSLIDVSNNIRPLLPYKKFQRDNQELVQGYLNEVKPFHVYIKSYTLKYNALDVYAMDFSDFDLPSKFNTAQGTFISPQLIYSGTPYGSQYLPTSTVWNEREYTKWFNNYGLQVTNEEVQYLPVTKLVQNNLVTTTTLPTAVGATTTQLATVVGMPSSGTLTINGSPFPYSAVNYFTRVVTLSVAAQFEYPVDTPVTVLLPVLSASAYTLQVQSAGPLPDNGVILVDSELIAYTNIDRLNGVLTGITRGYDNTGATEHSATADVYLQTLPVIVVAPGRGYTAQPTITAVIDTASTVAAWTSGTAYGIGDKVVYNGTGWICAISNSDLVFNGLNWADLNIYPQPRTAAQFTSTIANGQLTAVTVNNAGNGYAVMPAMIVEPSPITASWLATDMDLVTNQIYIAGHPFITGDSVVLSGTITDGTSLELGTYYWVNKINDDTIALYDTYENAIFGWSTEVPATATVVAITGDVLTMSDSDFVTGSQVKLVDATGQFYNYWAARTSLDPLFSADIALYNTLEDALADTNRVTTTAAVGDTISNVQMTDETRVVFDATTGGTLSVTAIVRAYTNERPVREMKVTMKFDRTSYRFNPTDDNAIARIEAFYQPTADMPGFKTDDYSQLMTGTQYPGVTLIDPDFVSGKTYVMLSSEVTLADNTITLKESQYSSAYVAGQPPVETVIAPSPTVAVAFADPVEMLFIESPLNNVYSSTFGLKNANSYWFKAVTATAVAAYPTKNDALNDINRVPLTVQWQGLLFPSKYNSVVSTTNTTTNEPYTVTGGTFQQGYAPEELLAGLITDTVNVTVTSKPGATWSPTLPATGLSNSSVMAHTGFNMARFTATPSTLTLRDGTTVANAIDFSGQVPNPVNLALYAGGQLYNASALPGAQRRLVIGDFTVDWVNQIIVITDTLVNTTPIDVVLYEYGNGNQLIRSNSTIYAMRTVMSPVPHTEILLDVPYQSGTATIDGVVYNVEGVTLPTAANYWETVAVFANGERLQYNDPAYPVTPGYTPPPIKFTVQPQRTLDPVNDPYNPAKLVFDGLFDPLVDYLSFAVSSDLAGISGISIPETQWFTGKAGVGVTLDLNAFLGDDNLVPPSADNIILEINGQRYDGSAPTTVQFTADPEVLAYPAPVYGLSGFDPLNLIVRVNGAIVAPSPTTWLNNFDALTLLPAGFDADFGLLFGYFDDGVPFDSTTMLAVVFDQGYLTPGDTITISYDSASVPEVFSVTANAGLVGGQLTLLAPVVSTDIISVTTFNRTTQQSLVTQAITDATVSLITGIVELTGAPVRVTTATEHNLEPQDYVTINGTAAPDLDGGNFYVQRIDLFTVTLWQDADLTIPVVFFNTGPLIPGQQSYIQAINVNETPSTPTPMSIDQPDFSLYNSDRLWVTIIRPGVPVGTLDLRDYVDPDRILLVNNTLVLLETVEPNDVIIITSMVPSASPNSTRFRINLDKYNGESGNTDAWGTGPWDIGNWSPYDPNVPNNVVPRADTVYRENQQTRTYLKVTMNTTLQPSDQMIVADAYRLVDIAKEVNQTIVNAIIDGVSTNYIEIIGIDTPVLTAVLVTLAGTVTPVTDFIVEVVNNNTVRLVFSTSPAGLVVDVQLVTGNQVMVQGEQIKFASIDLTTGAISNLERGVNGTIVNTALYEGSEVVAVIDSEELNRAYYDVSWYSAQTDTIPLQLTTSAPADFLNTVV